MKSLSDIINSLEERVSYLEQKIGLKVDKSDIPVIDEQVCEHDWIQISLDGGIFIGCPKCKTVDRDETMRINRELIAQKEEEE
ncbi:hypothetical protein PDM87_27945 [Bacillus cereus]|nr:hypothetical protein [Bacillus cereus]